MKQVINKDQTANIKIQHVNNLLELPADTEDFFEDDQAAFLKERYPWLTVSDVDDKEANKIRKAKKAQTDSDDESDGSDGEESGPSMDMTKSQLLEDAAVKDIDVDDNMTKQEILDAIEGDSEEVDEDSEVGDEDDESSEDDEESK